VDALYLSLVTMATLGYGDIVPTSEVLRVLAPIEALLGFGLLTAGLTWVISIYPVLTRRRSLAQEILVLHGAESGTGVAVEELDADTAARMLDDLASRVITARVDLMQFSITYYFHDIERKTALPATLPYLARLAERASAESRSPEVRLSSAALQDAIDDLADVLGTRFLSLSLASTEEALTAYARDQLRKPLDGDES
jgi:hypothetical protein